jgi:hypothetical protein
MAVRSIDKRSGPPQYAKTGVIEKIGNRWQGAESVLHSRCKTIRRVGFERVVAICL